MGGPLGIQITEIVAWCTVHGYWNTLDVQFIYMALAAMDATWLEYHYEEKADADSNSGN